MPTPNRPTMPQRRKQPRATTRLPGKKNPRRKAITPINPEERGKFCPTPIGLIRERHSDPMRKTTPWIPFPRSARHRGHASVAAPGERRAAGRSARTFPRSPATWSRRRLPARPAAASARRSGPRPRSGCIMSRPATFRCPDRPYSRAVRRSSGGWCLGRSFGSG